MVQESTLEIIQANDNLKVAPGQGTIISWRDTKDNDPRPVLVLGCPDCGKIHWCSNHSIQWHTENNTITLEPSLICTSCNAHFHIKESKIIPA